MATAENILVVAAEARELDGLLKRVSAQALSIPGIAFVREVKIGEHRLVLVANGPGPRLIQQALGAAAPLSKGKWTSIISTGFCGALDPDLQVGDIVTEAIWSEDRVAVTSAEKRKLREKTGARVVEMEFAAVAALAQQWGVPCRAVKVVSDTAHEDLPLDLNLYRDGEGRFRIARIASAGLLRPFTVLPGLMRLNRQSKIAAEKLGAFLADCKF